jgi:acyl-CoA thioesterase-1
MMTIAGALLTCSCVSPVTGKDASLAARDRVVCLGDSITDGYTYPQILIQALRESGKPVPTFICSGVGGNTAPEMAARLDKSVLVFKPRWVTFSAGANDALRDVTPAHYEEALREIVEKTQARGVRLMLLTPCVLLKRDGQTPDEQEAFAKKVQARLDDYERILRTVALEKGCVIAENRALMEAAVKAGRTILAPDHVHPNYEGQTLIARSILDAMGYRDVAIPKTFLPDLFPGIIREWKMRTAPPGSKDNEERLTPELVAKLDPDVSWTTYTLPDPAPANASSAEDWTEQLRRNGFALGIHDRVGGKRVWAVADVDANQEKSVWLQIGGYISTVWLNGVSVHDQGVAWTGFHAGKDRIPVRLKPGRNRLVVETGASHFFLSVTDERVWEDALQ